MRKFFAVVKREYVQRVRSRMFMLMTVLGPVMVSLFGVAPALVLSIRAGGPVRIAVVDQTGKLYQRVYESVMNDAGTPESSQNQMNANVLNKDASAIEDVRILESNHKLFTEITLGTIAENSLYYVANSQFGEYLEDRKTKINQPLIHSPPCNR